MGEKTYKRIMIATDGSAQVRKAVEAGINIAKLSRAKLYTVYVLVPVAHTIRETGWEKVAMEHLVDEGKKATGFIEDAAKAEGLEVESIFLKGHPADEIVKFAERNDVEMIVMGTLGKTGFDRFLLGSVAENVIRHSKVPVLVVRGDNSEESST